MLSSQTEDAISKQSDAEAVDLLRRIAEGNSAAAPEAATVDAARSLTEDDPAPTPEDGEAARMALALLADSDQHAGPLMAMLANPTAKRMLLDPVTATVLSAGILLALQTRVEFERKTDGKWSLKIKKAPTKTSLLGPLIKKLAALLH